jgi:LuxR family transcriptional regulator, maltose regulon positive regulatory protein
MAALSLRGTTDRARIARALEIRSHAITEYFIAEVLDQQQPEIAQFMLDTSVLDELTAGACAAVTGRQDSACLLRYLDAANLFLVAADDERSSFRYHQLVRQLLRAELRARDRAREQKLQLLAAEWFDTTGDTRQAIRYFLAAQQADRALALLQDRVAANFLLDPALPSPLDLTMVDPSSLTDAPDQLLAMAAHLLTCGDPARGGQYLDLLERAKPPIGPESRLAARFATMKSVHHALMGSLPSTRCPSPNAGGPPLSSWCCWTGPGSGLLVDRFATHWRPSRRPVASWPGSSVARLSPPATGLPQHPCRPGKANGRTLGAAAVTWPGWVRSPAAGTRWP